MLRHLVEDEVDVLRVGVFGQFGLRVEGLDAGGEVRHRLLAGLTEIFGVLRQLLAVDVGGEGLRQGHDVGVEFTLLDVLERLVELDVIQVQKGVGGDEDRHLPLFHVLVRGDDVLVALAGDDGEAIGLQGRLVVGKPQHLGDLLVVGDLRQVERQVVGLDARRDVNLHRLVEPGEAQGQVVGMRLRRLVGQQRHAEAVEERQRQGAAEQLEGIAAGKRAALRGGTTHNRTPSLAK